MAPNFFRYQAAANRAKGPNQRIRYIRGQGYRLVPGTRPNASNAIVQGVPAYVPPNREELWGQAEQRARRQSDPILQMIQERYDRDRQESIARQQAQLAGADKAVAAARDPLANLYNSAIGQATAVEEAVSNRLKGIQGERGTDLAARLAQMGAPETGASKELADTYQGASAAKYASGMSDVGRLVSRGAEARGWLEKQPLLFREQSEAQLAEALNELAKSFGDDRMEIMANIPSQIEDMYSKLYGEAEGRSKDIYEDRWKRVEWLRQRRLDAMEAQIAAREMNNKQAEAAARAQERELDRQLKWEIAQMNEDGRMARDNPPPVASDPNKKFNPDGSPNPNYVPPGVQGGNTPQQWRLRENAANKELNELMLGRDQGGRLTNRRSAFVQNNKSAAVNRRINAVLQRNQINPNSPRGIRLRKAAWSRAGVKTDAYGNPAARRERRGH